MTTTAIQSNGVALAYAEARLAPAAGGSRRLGIFPGAKKWETVDSWGFNMIYPLVNWHNSGKSPCLIGKPSISMGHLYHGYVSHNQKGNNQRKEINTHGTIWYPFFLRQFTSHEFSGTSGSLYQPPSPCWARLITVKIGMLGRSWWMGIPSSLSINLSQASIHWIIQLSSGERT